MLTTWRWALQLRRQSWQPTFVFIKNKLKIISKIITYLELLVFKSDGSKASKYFHRACAYAWPGRVRFHGELLWSVENTFAASPITVGICLVLLLRHSFDNQHNTVTSTSPALDFSLLIYPKNRYIVKEWRVFKAESQSIGTVESTFAPNT